MRALHDDWSTQHPISDRNAVEIWLIDQKTINTTTNPAIVCDWLKSSARNVGTTTSKCYNDTSWRKMELILRTRKPRVNVGVTPVTSYSPARLQWKCTCEYILVIDHFLAVCATSDSTRQAISKDTWEYILLIDYIHAMH